MGWNPSGPDFIRPVSQPSEVSVLLPPRLWNPGSCGLCNPARRLPRAPSTRTFSKGLLYIQDLDKHGIICFDIWLNRVNNYHKAFCSFIIVCVKPLILSDLSNKIKIFKESTMWVYICCSSSDIIEYRSANFFIINIFPQKIFKRNYIRMT